MNSDGAEDRCPPFVVTIDGPAGTGKSTVARELARQLEFAFLDTGAMYRAVAAACLDKTVDPDDGGAVSNVANDLQFDETTGAFPEIAGSLRTTEVTEAASRVARHPAVREQLVKWQRAFAHGKRLVTEGRDQGTVVFPDAACKFFLTASVDERTKRRILELQRAGSNPDFADIRRQIALRDERDCNRPIAPLRPAQDAQTIDTTIVSIEEVVAKLAHEVTGRLTKL